MDKKEEIPEDENVEVFSSITTFKMFTVLTGSKGEFEAIQAIQAKPKPRAEVTENLETAKESLHDAVDLEHAKTT